MKQQFSKVFIAAGWLDKIVRTHRGLHIIQAGSCVIVRDGLGKNPFEMGVCFMDVDQAVTAINGLILVPTWSSNEPR